MVLLAGMTLAELGLIGYLWGRCRKQERQMRELICEKELEFESLRQKARLDPLTSVYNKGVTRDLIERRLKQSDPQESHALMILDIDNFKSINDTYGHMLGDKVLVNIISHIRRMFHGEDIVGRIGGDEFVVFLNDVNSREEIVHRAGKVISAFQNDSLHQGREVAVTGSVGISVYPWDGTNYDELLEKADKALYSVKARGKNSFYLYSGEEESVNA